MCFIIAIPYLIGCGITYTLIEDHEFEEPLPFFFCAFWPITALIYIGKSIPRLIKNVAEKRKMKREKRGVEGTSEV